MRINHGVKVALVAATAGLMLSACSSDSDADATATATAMAEAGPDVAAIAENINTLTGCDAFGGSWAGGKVAGEGVIAGWEFTCDVDGDGVVETTVAIYEGTDMQEADLPNIEAASDTTGVLTGEYFTVSTSDTSHFASIANDDVTVVREVTIAE
ncbi:hypothetical protein [Demequina subtropica]|uniref:hypothetical protein n=1 Tax=Demequina subtropica TaxID=1638989 RepID=UPI000781884C|nr:hypothetical protein [Demequina subtropica]